jgi:hypothetical protein
MSPGLSDHPKNCPRRDETHSKQNSFLVLVLVFLILIIVLIIVIGGLGGSGGGSTMSSRSYRFVSPNVPYCLVQSSPVEEGCLTRCRKGRGLGCLRSGRDLKIQYIRLLFSSRKDIVYNLPKPGGGGGMAAAGNGSEKYQQSVTGKIQKKPFKSHVFFVCLIL